MIDWLFDIARISSLVSDATGPHILTVYYSESPLFRRLGLELGLLEVTLGIGLVDLRNSGRSEWRTFEMADGNRL